MEVILSFSHRIDATAAAAYLEMADIPYQLVPNAEAGPSAVYLTVDEGNSQRARDVLHREGLVQEEASRFDHSRFGAVKTPPVVQAESIATGYSHQETQAKSEPVVQSPPAANKKEDKKKNPVMMVLRVLAIFYLLSKAFSACN